MTTRSGADEVPAFKRRRSPCPRVPPPAGEHAGAAGPGSVGFGPESTWKALGRMAAATFVAACCLGSAGAGTVDPARATHLRYEAWWGGLYAAEFTLTLDDRGGAYETAFSLGTRGLLDWLIGLDLEAASTGATGDGLTPEAYRSKYRSNSREGTTAIAFDPETGEATVSRNVVFFEPREPETDDPARPQVPADLRTGVLDPLSAFAEAIDRLRRVDDPDAMAPFTVAIFDGKRRFDMSGEMLGRVPHETGDRTGEAYKLRLTTSPVAGFRERTRMLWDDTVFDVYVSADGRFVPIQIVARGWGPAINLVEECARPCTLTPRD